MKSRCARLASQAMGVLSVGVAGLIIAALPAMAQQGPPPPIENPSPFADLRDRQQREAALRGAEMIPGKKQPDARRSQQIAEQVREDYKRLQVLRNEMVRDLTSNKPLDYKHITERTAEINKRASRLKDALALRNPDEGSKGQTPPATLDNGQLKEALVNLSNGIITFVENPMFKSPAVLDAQDVTKAGRLICNIIDLSSNIRKNAGKLGKD